MRQREDIQLSGITGSCGSGAGTDCGTRPMSMGKFISVALFLAFISVATAVAQSDLSSNSNTTPKIGAIPCPDTTEQQACDSFNELRKENDESIDGLTMPTHSPKALRFVCFADGQDLFFTIFYGNSNVNPKTWTFYIGFYRNGFSDPRYGPDLFLAQPVGENEPEDMPPPISRTRVPILGRLSAKLQSTKP